MPHPFVPPSAQAAPPVLLEYEPPPWPGKSRSPWKIARWALVAWGMAGLARHAIDIVRLPSRWPPDLVDALIALPDVPGLAMITVAAFAGLRWRRSLLIVGATLQIASDVIRLPLLHFVAHLQLSAGVWLSLALSQLQGLIVPAAIMAIAWRTTTFGGPADALPPSPDGLDTGGTFARHPGVWLCVGQIPGAVGLLVNGMAAIDWLPLRPALTTTLIGLTGSLLSLVLSLFICRVPSYRKPATACASFHSACILFGYLIWGSLAALT